MGNLFNPRYWFELVPGTPNLLFWKIVFIGAAAVMLFAIVAAVLARRNKRDGIRSKIWYRFSVWGFSVGIISLLLGFFRFQDAYLLSMRAWIFVWLAVSAARLARILWYVVLIAPRRMREREERQAYEQYLPQRKS